MTIITQTADFPQWLRAISIHAPHAYAICIGVKKQEYRTKSTNYRGWALIHASGSKASDDCFKDYFIDPKAIGVKRYAIIGAVEIYDCIGSLGDYAYCLRSPIAFPKPLEGIKGQQSIFWGATTPERVKAFAEAWMILQSRLK
jgi:hypothetical protein